MALPHRTQILYLADIAFITSWLDIKRGSCVIEAGKYNSFWMTLLFGLESIHDAAPLVGSQQEKEYTWVIDPFSVRPWRTTSS